MDCEHIREQLSARIDNQLDVAATAAVDAHLAVCASCRAERATLESVNAALCGAFSRESSRAAVVAERAIGHWREITTVPVRRPSKNSRSLRRMFGYLLAAVAGFLLATGLFMPAWQIDLNNVPNAPMANNPDVPPAPAYAAHIVRATGALQIRPPQSEEWQSVPLDASAQFACPAEAKLRTMADALCELNTSNGSRLRLNEQTEIALRTADEVELVAGQLWCQVPEQASLRVVTDGQPSRRTQWTCPSASECVGVIPAEGPMRIMAAVGTVSVTVADQQLSLERGSVCAIDGDDVSVRQSTEEQLLATRWMQPLMAIQGHDNPELAGRVDALLARIGRAKVSYLYEQDLRNLGEYGALPLLRFVQLAAPEQDRERRQTATRILVDTAPIWMARGLIDLLEDSDAVVRAHAARTLTRLTNETQGLSEDDWRSDDDKRAAGVAAWNEWWTTHSLTCAPPPAGVQLPRKPRVPEGLLKARN